MGLERASSQVPVLPASFTSIGGIRHYTPQVGCLRGGQVLGLPRATFFSTEKEHRQEEGDSRPLYPQQVHSMSSLQDDNHPESKGDSTKGHLHHLSRHGGGILPCPYTPKLPVVPRLPSRQPDVSLQGSTIWPQHCPWCVHKTPQHRRQPFKRPGSLSSGIPR